jgi:hypothetical protein
LNFNTHSSLTHGGVGVRVASVAVGDRVLVAVGVRVTVAEAVRVAVRVAVAVIEAVRVAVAVRVIVDVALHLPPFAEAIDWISVADNAALKTSISFSVNSENLGA